VDIARSTGYRHKALSAGGSADSSDKGDSCKYVELVVANRQQKVDFHLEGGGASEQGANNSSW